MGRLPAALLLRPGLLTSVVPPELACDAGLCDSIESALTPGLNFPVDPFVLPSETPDDCELCRRDSAGLRLEAEVDATCTCFLPVGVNLFSVFPAAGGVGRDWIANAKPLVLPEDVSTSLIASSSDS